MSQSTLLKVISSESIRKFALCLSGTFLLGLSGGIFAQSKLLEEVIVTAQKREESLQDVGIAITAFTGEQLDAFGFTNSTELTAFTPGVHVSGNNGGATQQFTIRGATQNDFFDLAEAPNAVYIDGAYMASGQAHLFAQFDMERVEILKGPQGKNCRRPLILGKHKEIQWEFTGGRISHFIFFQIRSLEYTIQGFAGILSSFNSL